MYQSVKNTRDVTSAFECMACKRLGQNQVRLFDPRQVPDSCRCIVCGDGMVYIGGRIEDRCIGSFRDRLVNAELEERIAMAERASLWRHATQHQPGDESQVQPT